MDYTKGENEYRAITKVIWFLYDMKDELCDGMWEQFSEVYDQIGKDTFNWVRNKGKEPEWGNYKEWIDEINIEYGYPRLFL